MHYIHNAHRHLPHFLSFPFFPVPYSFSFLTLFLFLFSLCMHGAAVEGIRISRQDFISVLDHNPEVYTHFFFSPLLFFFLCILIVKYQYLMGLCACMWICDHVNFYFCFSLSIYSLLISPLFKVYRVMLKELLSKFQVPLKNEYMYVYVFVFVFVYKEVWKKFLFKKAQ